MSLAALLISVGSHRFLLQASKAKLYPHSFLILLGNQALLQFDLDSHVLLADNLIKHPLSQYALHDTCLNNCYNENYYQVYQHPSTFEPALHASMLDSAAQVDQNRRHSRTKDLEYISLSHQKIAVLFPSH